MASNCSEGLGDDFFEQILAVPSPYTNTATSEGATGAVYGRRVGDVDSMAVPMLLQLGSTSGDGGLSLRGSLGSIEVGMPLGLNLEQSFGGRRFSEDDVNVVEGSNSSHHHLRLNNNNNTNANNRTTSSSSSTSGIIERNSMHMTGLFPALGQLHTHAHAHAQSVRPTVPSPVPPQLHPTGRQHFHRQPPIPVSVAAVPQPPGIRPRVRARRGQATDPHSIAERLRRERIAERMRALQELVPSANKTDKAAMLDEIVDYVKFLRLQVKVLSMSRLGGAGAVAQLVADVPLSALEGEDIEGGANQQAWDKWSSDGTEQEVAKLMEEDVGAAMQFLQSKALCMMPVSLASAIFCTPQSEASTLIKPESNSHS